MEKINFLILGKPNSGKSTFYNTLNNKYLSPTGPESGLTKDIFKSEVEILNTKFVFFDTPGLRRKNKINDKFSSKNIVHNNTSLPEKINESKPLQHVNISDLLTAHKKGGRDA